jgi:hypothetical protein
MIVVRSALWLGESDRGLRNSENPTSDNLKPQETTNQADFEAGGDGAETGARRSADTIETEVGELCSDVLPVWPPLSQTSRMMTSRTKCCRVLPHECSYTTVQLPPLS